MEIDGCYVGDYDRPANKADERKEKRKQRRRSRKQAQADAVRGAQTGGKRCILVLRQRPAKDEGGHVVPGDTGRTIARVIASENATDIERIVHAFVDPTATVVTDEAGAYMGLAAWFKHRSVNHSKEYSADDGTNTNYVESYFSRLRRMEIGQTHKFGSHLELYAAEAAYKEDMRRTDNGTTAWDVIRRVLRTPKDDYWNGYWLLHRRSGAPVSSTVFAAAA